MPSFLNSIICSILLASLAIAAPASSGTAVASAAEPSETVPVASDDPNYVEWNVTSPTSDPQPIRGTLGTTIMAQANIPLELQNPDALAPPTTDHGLIPNPKWSFSQSHNRLQTGGWARQQNEDVMPIATALAAVDMRLEPGAVRELHWHKTAEWSYVLSGQVQVTAIDQNGKNYLSTLNQGDLWYFPPGMPHSLQATNQSDEGCEFLLVFDDGAFSEDSTFLLTDWMAHIPMEVLAKNFKTSITSFDHIPAEELYIFPAAPPSPNAVAVLDPQGTVPEAMSFEFSKMAATPLAGGTIKIADTSNFPISTTVCVAEVTVDVGAMRELHWHPTEPEWSYFISGFARITIFASSQTANTYNFQAGDIAYVPPSYGHYIENTGNTTLHYLEIFASDRVEDVSLSQWLALTPPALVKAHLGFSDEMIASLNKTKGYVV